MAEKVKAEGIKRPDSVRVEAMGVSAQVRTDALDDYDVLCAIDEAGADSLRGCSCSCAPCSATSTTASSTSCATGTGGCP